MKVFQTEFLKSEILELNEIIMSGQLGFGPNVSKFENRFEDFSKKKYNIATNSASASAFMIFSYLKEKYGPCDVYTPSLAFTSPAWAAKHFGHNIIWIDIDNNLLFDCKDYREKRKKNKKQKKQVVMPILYSGVSNIKDWNLYGDEIVVTDSAHCITPSIPSDFIFFSFHTYKPICSSDGGMISTDQDGAQEYFNRYRNFGRINKNNTYDISQEGFKFYMNNLNASIALISMEKYHSNLEIRKSNFSSLANKYDLLDHDEGSSYYFASLLDIEADKINEKYELARHYPMLHKTTHFKDGTNLPNTEKLHKRIVNLPLWKHL